MIIAVLGLGEAGGAFAKDLVSVGLTVQAWDPAPKHIPTGVNFIGSNIEAIQNKEIDREKIVSCGSALRRFCVAICRDDCGDDPGWRERHRNCLILRRAG